MKNVTRWILGRNRCISKKDAQSGVNLTDEPLGPRSTSTLPVSRQLHPFWGFADLGEDRGDDPPDVWADGIVNGSGMGHTMPTTRRRFGGY